tara:strand:- start:58 stop:342 length:285 start_codon:yes stop_codon:yes gene_type:complete
MIKVRNMTNKNWNIVPNQFILNDTENGIEYFQSYAATIVKSVPNDGIYLDEKYWDYSTTTGRYRNQYLGDSGIAETRKKIADGTYKLTDLNKRK